ncbi:hypothetical protein COU15_00055 [Candidatus Kaiserbacteria bacterium CG10_big_fil_rev_8_21_14_0_10_45_20]|uniref:Uncharacterized protein n=1 Tax=Candidatus Kaiserbacteria bacterium CG10_big_fil_rev_8_21_14_0_10_45_20 TaxID=1974607 RepID=A0A2H0UI58_9BACT|nr:MAG: hypothetical protein COU15_00055 [Candidatus Kaiserbacteria bacterium CG10_big_fil_rev_8_21_14_0_10_45_20]
MNKPHFIREAIKRSGTDERARTKLSQAGKKGAEARAKKIAERKDRDEMFSEKYGDKKLKDAKLLRKREEERGVDPSVLEDIGY